MAGAARVSVGNTEYERTRRERADFARDARGGRGPGTGLGLTDSIYNRLLKERIIWLGSEVRDDNANAICAQMLLLAARIPTRTSTCTSTAPGLSDRRHGHL